MAGRGIVIKIEGDGESARKALEMVREQLKQTSEEGKRDASELAGAMDTVKEALAGVGIGLGVAEALRGMKELVSGSLELGESLEKASQKTGLAVSTLSTLHYAAAITGQDFDRTTSAVAKMDKTIGAAATGNKAAEATMRELGLNAKDLAGRSDGAEIAFKKLSTTIAATENPIVRAKIATDALGKAGAEQIPMLIEIGSHWDEWVSKAKNAGVYLDGEQAAILAEANRRWEDLKQHVQGAGLEFTEGLLPALQHTMNAFTGTSGSSDVWTKAGLQAGNVALQAANSFAVLVKFLREADAEYKSWESHVNYYGGDIEESKTNWTKESRDKAAARAAADIAESQDAVREMKDAETEYAKVREELTKGLWDGKKPVADMLPKVTPETKSAGGGTGGTLAGTGTAAKSTDAVAVARAQLEEQNAKNLADQQKQQDQVALAALEAQHKMLLISDKDYYDQKLKLQNDELTAQQAQLESRMATLGALYNKQHADKTLKRDKSGTSAEEEKTAKELLQVEDQLSQVEARRAEIKSGAAAQAYVSAQAAELAGLRAAAELEKQRNQGITAQIALLQKETELKAAANKREGGTDQDQANIRALGQIEEQKLRIEEINRQIEQSENDNKRAVAALNDEIRKDPRLKASATKQINELNKQEAATVADLVKQYQALAAAIGDPALIEKAKDLQAELDKLNRPNQQADAKFDKTIEEGMTSMSQTIASEAIKGKTSFADMARSIEADAAKLAIKLAMMKIMGDAGSGGGSGGGGLGSAIGKFFSNLLGSGGSGGGGGSDGGGGEAAGSTGILGDAGGFTGAGGLDAYASGGDNIGDKPAIIGERGPEIWAPPTRGGSIISNSSLAQKLSETGGGGKAPNVSMSIVNNSRQPVTASAPDVDFDSRMRDMVVRVVLEDHAGGGPISQVSGGGG